MRECWYEFNTWWGYAIIKHIDYYKIQYDLIKASLVIASLRYIFTDQMILFNMTSSFITKILMVLSVLKSLHLQDTYRQVSNISRTKSQHLKDSLTVLQRFLPHSLKPDIKLRMKM